MIENLILLIIITTISSIAISRFKKSSKSQKHGFANQREKRLMYNCFKHDFK